MVMSVEHGTLDRGRLNHIRRHVCGTKIRAACLGSKLGLNIDTYVDLAGVAMMRFSGLAATFLQENSLKQGVFIS